MGRYAGGGRSNGAGSTTLPLMSLYSPAGNGGALREVGIFNTTATAVAVALRRLTSAGTQGAGLSELEMDEDQPAPTMTLFDTHTVGPTITAGNVRVGSLGAAIGSGVIWTFGGRGLVIPPGAGNGVGVAILSGTGQICDIYWEWEE